jgi:coiled-coil domain-containing protein 130
MSSLAAASADGYYYPPEYARSGLESLNKFRNSHCLGKRAAKISQGIIVVRFEMPYHAWCLGCGVHIMRGVRYNAEKKRIGKYHTSPIYEFKMKCHFCPQMLTMQNDPAARDYRFAFELLFIKILLCL